MDILIPEDLANAERILAGLANLPLRLAEEFTPEEVIARPFTIIGDWTRVDLLTRAGKARFELLWETHLTSTVSGVQVPYPDLEGLILAKQTDRLQDRADIERLQEIRRLTTS